MSPPVTAPAEYERPCIPDYELLRRIGSGTYGDVWLARTAAGGLRAIKIVYRSRFTDARPYEREFAGLRFFEAISLKDRNQLALLHLSRDETRKLFYYVMELADDLDTGVDIEPDRYVPATLSNILKPREPLPSEDVLRIGCELARGLESLHSRGLVHRDVKPSNVIFVGGHAKLADVGLVTPTDACLSNVGTDGYIPPEGNGSPAGDVFALGRVLYECVTGHSRHDFPRLPMDFEKRRDREAFLELNQVLIKACAADPSGRYANGGEMLQDLLRASSLSLRSSQRRERLIYRIQWLTAILLVLGVVAAATLWRARVREQKQLQHLAAAVASVGFRVAEDGDWLGALPWVAASAEMGLRHQASDPHLDQLAVVLEQCPRLRVLHKYSGHINDMHFDPVSRLLAVAAESGELDFWDLPAGRIWRRVHPFTGTDLGATRTGAVQCVRFSPDGSLVAMASDNGRLIISSRKNPTVAIADIQFEHVDGMRGPTINGLAFSPDGRLLAVARSGVLWLTEVEKGEIRQVFHRRLEGLQTVTFSADGRYLLCSCRENGLIRLDLNDPDSDRKVFEHQGVVYACVSSPTSGHAFTASSTGDVTEWDVERSQLIRSFPHDGAVTSLSMSSDGTQLLSACRGGYLGRWNTRTAISVHARLPQPHAALIAAISPDARYSAGGSNDGLLSVWDHREGMLPAPEAPEGWYFVQRTPWTSNSLMKLALQGWDDGTGVSSFPGLASLASLDVEPGGSVAACYRTGEGWLMTWNSGDGGDMRMLVLPPDVEEVLCTDARDGLVLALTSDRKLLLWSAAKCSTTWESETGLEGRVRAELSPDRTFILCTSATSALKICLGERPQVFALSVGQPGGTPPGLIASAISPDGQWLALGCATGREEACPILIYPTSPSGSTNAAFRLEGHRDGIRVLAFSPDSRLLVSGGEDGLAVLWRTQDWARQGEPLRHRGQVIHLAFSTDGSRLLSAIRTQLRRTDTLKLWRTADGTPASAAIKLDANITRIGFSREFDAWLWTSGGDGAVIQGGSRLFAPRRGRRDAATLMSMAEMLSGRRLGRAQEEIIVPPERRLKLHSDLVRQNPDELASYRP